MSYTTARAMLLMGRSFKKGDVVPDQVITELPYGRLRSLTNTGMLRQVEFTEEQPVADTPQPAEGETCPECGEGPFKRLDRHQLKHQEA